MTGIIQIVAPRQRSGRRCTIRGAEILLFGVQESRPETKLFYAVARIKCSSGLRAAARQSGWKRLSSQIDGVERPRYRQHQSAKTWVVAGNATR